MPLTAQMQHVSDAISYHLQEIGKHFKDAKVTLIIRAPALEDGDWVFTDDDPHKAIEGIERLIARGPSSE